jgi:hypothetical protein
MKKKAEGLLRDWMKLVNAADVEGVLKLYDKEAVLIPTFSNRLLVKPADLRDYFVRLCAREHLSLSLHEKTLRILPIREEVCSASGIYAWKFDVDGEPLTFEARFSYTMDLSRPAPIVIHHSSQIPRML